MGQQISVQIEDGGDGAKGGQCLSLTPTPRKQSPPSGAAASSSSGPSTPQQQQQLLPAPPLGQPNPDDESVIDLCDSPAAASTPTTGGGSSSSSPSSASSRFVLIEIPEDVTRCLLTSLSLSSVVKLCVCSKSLAESVYSRSYLFEKIDLSALSYTQRDHGFTDRSLHRLLEAVNAKEVTKALSLRTCHQIRGFGLEPLRGSAVLEELDLRVKSYTLSPPDGTTGLLEDNFVLNLLRTMMPFARPTNANQRSAMTSRLFTVRFHGQKKPPLVDGVAMANRIHDCFQPYGQMKKFLESFDGSLKDRLWVERVPCEHCDGPLVEKVPSEQLETMDASALRCSECKSISCGQKECPPSRRCQMCFSDLCCIGVGKCDACRMTVCSNCYEVEKCQGPCNRNLCERCSMVFTCGHCAKSFCEQCKDMGLCEECEEWFCPECVKLEFCGPYADCGFCDGCYPNPNSCSRCDAAFCRQCDPNEIFLCDGCDELVCIFCEKLSDPCGRCTGMFCSKCRVVSSTQDCCDEQYCNSCHPNFDTCSLCRKCPSCCGDVSGCSQCGSWYGDKCLKVDECRDCALTFCGYCSTTDSKGGLSPCSYCHEPICLSCREDSKVPGVPSSVPFCSNCSENVQATSIAGGGDSSCCSGDDRQRRSRKNKAEALSSQLCEHNLERARARRRLEAANEKVRAVEEKLLVGDPGWFPADSIL